MNECVGNSYVDLRNLKSSGQFVRLPGPLRMKHPDLDTRQLLEVAMEEPVKWQTAAEQQRITYQNDVESQGIDDGHKYSFMLSLLGDTHVYLEGFSFRKRVKIRLQRMMREMEDVEDDEDLEDVVEEIPKNTGLTSERSTIHQVAKMLEFPVHVTEYGQYWQVTPKVVGVKSKATRVPGQRQTVLTWLLGLPLCEPTTMPREIVENVSDTYLRVILADKSVPYYFSYRKGKVTKYKAALRDGNLYVSGKRVGPCDNRTLLELLLIPYALEPKDVLNPKAPRTGSDTSCETLVDPG